MNHLVIIGGGPGGYVAAFAAAKSGMQVTIIEQETIGGTCLNKGCIPTKTIKSSAEVLQRGKRFAEFGITGCDELHIQMPDVIARKNKVRDVLVTGLEKSCKTLGIRLIQGRGELAEGNTVLAHTSEGIEEIVANHILIATGSENLALPSLPIDHSHIITSDDALNLSHVPDHVLIVGGGVIGCEFAFILKEFGAKVTIVEGQDRLLPLPSVDEDISKLLLREAKKNKISVELATTVRNATVRPDGIVECELGPSPFVESAKTKEKRIEASLVLVSVGRTPMTKGLGLEAAGVAVDKRGWISVNERLQTTAPNIYAIGDVLGPSKVMLAHVASAEGLCAVDNCLGKAREMRYEIIPSAIFTTPEIGTVGLSEAQATAAGYEIMVNTFQCRELGKAQAMGELPGLFKIIADAKTGKILGVHIAGAHATDLIAEATLALSQGSTAMDIAQTIHAHPTLAEGLWEAVLPLATQFS